MAWGSFLREEVMKLPVLLLVLACIPLVSAVDIIKDISFSGDGVTRVDNKTYAPPAREVAAQMTFTLLAPYDSVVLDLSALNTRARETNLRYVQASQCTNRVCTVSVPLMLNTTNQYKDVGIRAVYDSSRSDTKQYRLYTDTTKPALQGIGTATCTKDCAVHAGENTIVAYFTERESGIDESTAFLVLNGEPIPPADCTVDSCSYDVDVSSGITSLKVSLSSGVSDRAGNALAPTSLDSTFRVDDTAPQIVKTEVVGTSPIVTGPFKLRATVADADRHITAVADISALTDGNGTNKSLVNVSCEAGVCLFDITPRAGTYEGTVTFTVKDSAGNEADGSIGVSVARTESIEGVKWTSSGTVAPKTLDTASATIFRKTFYMTVPLTSSDPATSVAYVSPRSCTITNGSKTFVTPEVSTLHERSKTPVIIVTVPATENFRYAQGTGLVNCSLNVYYYKGAGEDAVMSSAPAVVNVSDSFVMAASPLLPQLIDGAKQKADDDLQHLQAATADLRKIQYFGTALCTGRIGLSTGVIGINKAEAQVGSQAPPIGDAAAKPLTGAGISLTSLGLSVDQFAGNPMCEMLSCTLGDEVLGKVSDGILLGMNDNSKIKGALDTASGFTTGQKDVKSLVSPYRSWPLAVGTACIPAMIVHMENLKGIQCNYNTCLETQTTLGYPLSGCEAQKGYMQCKYIYGGLFYTSPLGVVQSIRDGVLSLVSNPITMTTYAASLACSPEPAVFHAACSIPPTVKRVFSYQQQLMDIMSNVKLFTGRQTNTACDQSAAYVRDFRAQFAEATCGANICQHDGNIRVGASYYRVVRNPTVTSAPNQNGQRVAQVEIGNVEPGFDTTQPAVPVDKQLSFIAPSGYHVELVSDPKSIPVRSKEQIDAGYEAMHGSDVVSNLAPGFSQAILDAQAAQKESAEADSKVQNFEKLMQFAETVDVKKYKDSYQTQLRDKMSRDMIEIPAEGKVPAHSYPAHSEEYYLAEIAAEQLVVSADPAVMASAKTALRDALLFPPGEQRSKALNTALSSGGLKDMKKVLVDDAKTKKKAAEDKRKEAKKMFDEEQMRQRETDWNFKLVEAAQTAQMMNAMVNSVSPMLSRYGVNTPRWVTQGWLNQDSDVLQMTDFEEQTTARVCSVSSDIRRERGIIAFDSKNNIGLYIQGSRSVSGDDNSTYQYLIGGAIMLPTDGKTLTYTVSLSSDSGESVIDTGEIPVGSSKVWRGAGLLRNETESKYDKVCLNLNENIDDLFPRQVYKGFDSRADDKSVCVPLIILEDGR